MDSFQRGELHRLGSDRKLASRGRWDHERLPAVNGNRSSDHDAGLGDFRATSPNAPTNHCRQARIIHGNNCPLRSGRASARTRSSSALGAGGMGEVYRARDTKLESRCRAEDPARPTFARDPERLARFQREAQVLASLNHPHIAPIYGLEESGRRHRAGAGTGRGADAGGSDRAGPDSARRGAADRAADRRGARSRARAGDHPPRSEAREIKVRADGTVKVLDFGLAKALEPAGRRPRATSTNSPTITTPAMTTGVGMILGTAAYMVPEQAKGKPADKRSDIWAFGVRALRDAHGQRAFEGDDISRHARGGVASETSTGRRCRRRRRRRSASLARCLEKDAGGGCGDIGDALFVLRSTAGDIRSAAHRCRSSRRPSPSGDARFPSCSPRSWPARWPEPPRGISASDPRRRWP